MVNWDRQRVWDEVVHGEELSPLSFPLSVYRLVLEAGANRDFNSIHHNSVVAKASGAPDMYANAYFLQGMWERLVREYIGVHGRFVRLTGFRMHRLNPAGTTVIVYGRVTKKWIASGLGLVEIAVWSQNDGQVSVGPGAVIVALPFASGQPSDEDVASWLSSLRPATTSRDKSTPVADHWQLPWKRVIDSVGAELGAPAVAYGVDFVDGSALRRYLEPLEFDCPLHSSADAARSAGYRDLVLPWSAYIPFTLGAFWNPGETPAFVDPAYEAQPTRSPYAIHEPIPHAPATSAFMGTETSSMDFLAPVVLGDRLGTFGRKLVDCQPKQTRIGQGAFVRFQAEIRNQHDTPVSRNIRQYFYYDPI